MARTWDSFAYSIAGHYLAALINADVSGLSDDEARDLAEFERVAKGAARADGWSVGHWDCDEGEPNDWGRCDVSGLAAMRAGVRLMVYRDDMTEQSPRTPAIGQGVAA